MLEVVELEKSTNVTVLFLSNRRIDSNYVKGSNWMVLSSKVLSHDGQRNAERPDQY